VLAKIHHDHAHRLMVILHWEGAAWWHPVMNLAKKIFEIPEFDLIRYPATPSLRSKKKLVLWLISF
jgi:hypothetical protein